MSSPYIITINAAEGVPMQSLNLAFTGLSLANMQHDVASLKWSRQKASVACPIAHNDMLEIFRQGRRLFRGRARLGTVTTDGMPIQVIGPWSHLEEQVYQASLFFGSYGTPAGKVLGDTFTSTYPPGTIIWDGHDWVTLGSSLTITWTVSTRASWTYPSTTGTVDVNMAWASRCWLFRPGGTVGQVYTSLQDEWTRLMTFMTTTNNPDLIDVGTVALGGALAPRVRTISDMQASEVLRQILAMKPDAAVWWDYSGTGLPKINVRVASLEAAGVLLIGSNEGQALQGYQLKVMDELRPSGVVIRWERDESAATGLGRPYLADIYPGMEVVTGCGTTNASNVVSCSSSANLAVGMMVSGGYVPSGALITGILSGTSFRISVNATGTLAGQRMVFRAASGVASHQPGVLLHTVTDEMPIVPGIAKDVYLSLAVRRAQGSLSVLDRDFSSGLRPGAVFTLDGDPAFAGVQLWVQGVSWSPDTGIAQLTVGYPAHLQLRDRVDLRGWLRASFNGPFWSWSWIVPPP
jgi:hypothetical protein